MGDDGNIVEGDNAQTFFQNKLKSQTAGRYTQEQIDKINQSGGYAVVNASDGFIPGGPAYDADNPTKNQGGEESKSGSGAMTPEEIREKFGLKYNEKHAEMSAPGKYSKNTGGDGFANDKGAIFTESGEYVGSVKGDGDEDYYAGYSKLTDAASDIKKEAEGKGFSNVNSLSDVAGAVHWLTKGGEEEKAPVEEKENEPIRHSPEIKQAIERVRTYENDINSGKISDDIFGGGAANSAYGFDSNKGAAGIGTPAGAVNNVDAKASANFLSAKKDSIKKQYNFRPAKTGAAR